MNPKLLILLCVTAILARLGDGESKVSDDMQRARLPEFLTELDLASLEASEEDVDSLKKIVKRLTPAKNGEYLIYQVFFGNEDLLKEWLKGAGVMGQPGVDFPVLTTIPATKFSCRGVKGGYYADLETNCQVFHICDNGRKISFLCPNGTIFQQSQLICDWWFKVDCGKSAELYEQSAEHLAEEERKRADAKKMNSEFHRTSGSKNNGQVYYQSQNQNVDYDGKQNGRTNPFGQTTAQNQNSNGQQTERETTSNSQQQNGRSGNQFSQGQVTSPQATRSSQYNQNYSYNQQDNINGNSQQSIRQNFNNYNTRTGDGKQSHNTQDYFGATPNSNAPHDDKSNHRSPKAFGDLRNNFNEVTTAANPFREYQQLAESASFATSRNNRYNKSFQYNQFGNYYSSNQVTGTEGREKAVQNSLDGLRQNQTPKKVEGNSGAPLNTFAPIYKPRTTTTTATPFLGNGAGITTQRAYVNTDIYRHNTATQTSYSNPEIVTQNPYSQNTNYQQNSETLGNTYATSNTQGINRPSTQKPYVNTDTYRHGGEFTTVTETPTTWTSYDQTTTTPLPMDVEMFKRDGTTGGVRILTTERYVDNYETHTVTGSTGYYGSRKNSQRWNTVGGVTPSTNDNEGITDRTPKNFAQGVQRPRENVVKESTEKPFLDNGDGYQQVVVTDRNLSPYDTSFTYRNGKISSTIGPYVPFTKNYAYTTTTTTTTTSTPPVYTATVPTIPDNRKLANTASTAATPWYSQTETSIVNGRSEAEREHAIEMLHSLQELESTPSISGNQNGSRIGLNIPPSSGPATLHTLALYFATAGENFDSNETATDTAVRIGNEGEEGVGFTTEATTSAELPTNLLTQNTIRSYTDLFNINSALQSVDKSTVETRLTEDDDVNDSSKDDVDNDLDLQQSQGPVSGTNQRKNNPKLRELAQVFTHALSAYLQDPETFRKVLTEIRPTEPPTTLTFESTETTTSYPTTQDDYPSATKEKDEVLDFSDVTKASRRKKLTTPYPTTTQTFTTPLENTYRPYYTTIPSVIDESLNEAQSSDFRSSGNAVRNDFAREVNHAFRISGSNDLQGYNPDASGPSGPSAPSAPQNEHDSYFPIGPAFSANRFGGFQNNSANTHAPYGKGVKPTDATPIGTNYVPDPTPASYAHSQNHNAGNFEAPLNDDPLGGFSSSNFGDYSNIDNFVTPKSILQKFNTEDVTTTFSDDKENKIFSTKKPFRINYFESSTKRPRETDESLVTAGTVRSSFRNNRNENFWHSDKVTQTTFNVETTTDYPNSATTQTNDNSGRYTQQPSTNYWTSSPIVTSLWETTVFLDPKHINHELTGSRDDTLSTGVENYETTPISKKEILVTDASGVGRTTQYEGTNTPPWKWTPNNDDSPTAFTLLPTVYSTQNTATPAPTYTTHSSITTTITSSVSSSTKAVPQEKSRSISISAYNVTENEIIKAKEIFGGLNATSSNTLMKVMKQADNNSTVRQLVLLLISHCKGPMNKTMEEEKEQLLDALLRMPVNEFSSEESRDIIAGINKLQLPLGRSVEEATTVPPTDAPTTISVTTYRSRRGRKFRTTTDSPTRLNDVDIAETANALSIEPDSPSDSRALELLKSLYTIAAKWG